MAVPTRVAVRDTGAVGDLTLTAPTRLLAWPAWSSRTLLVKSSEDDTDASSMDASTVVAWRSSSADSDSGTLTLDVRNGDVTGDEDVEMGCTAPDTSAGDGDAT